MDFKLELVLVPVSDVDRAKQFYVDTCGFNLDVDHQPNEKFRVVQITPPGSACSLTIGLGLSDAAPGSYRGTHLVVTDIDAARAELVGRGVDVSEIRHMGPNGWEPVRTPSTATTARSPTSAIPTATPGFCRKPGAASSEQQRDAPAAPLVRMPPAVDEAYAGRGSRRTGRVCQRPNSFPCGSLQVANQPMLGTGIGSSASPPSSCTRAAPALMSSTSK